MKKFFSLVLAAGMAFSLAACGANASSSAGVDSGAAGSSAPAGDTIKIGVLAPLSGDVSQYGIAVNNGIMLAMEEINEAGGALGKQIELVPYDEKGDPTEAINAYNKLVQDDKVVAILGDVTTKPSIAVAQKAAKDGMPLLSASATGLAFTEAGENVFRACFTDPYQGELMANYAFEKLEAKTAAILYDTGDDYSQGVADAFEAAAKELGMVITSKEGYQPKSVDFNAQLTKIKEDAPDVIMAPCYYSDAANILVQARNMKIESKFLGPDGWDGVLNQVDDSNKALLNGSYYCSQYSPQSEDADLQAFLTKYREKYKMDENMFAVLGYDAAYIMVAAIEAAGSTDADAIVTALAATNHKGLTGTTTFDANRNPVREAYITSFEDGEAKVLETYSFG